MRNLLILLLLISSTFAETLGTSPIATDNNGINTPSGIYLFIKLMQMPKNLQIKCLLINLAQ